ncbi:hypothetical protein IVB25_01940 [Bradyrhizobium sp. 193]|uniref:hypothetical protein n=1 Tax=Bradyrhizobium sp. 193 TaxID=2782661 RepID=UPI001FF888E7|nr:hypothetical protein [Bradyrhizobium sp. 193]MCK1481534.1 hypothetical protein [Bradyrhizobium sp. 193]
MPKVLPSQIVSAIDSMFSPNRTEIDGHAITNTHRAEVYALLNLLNEVPSDLIDLSSPDYLEYSRCRAVLATSLALWDGGDIRAARDVGGKDAVERIRRLMKQCRDELPPPEPLLPFVQDADIRFGIEDRIKASWTDYSAQEWMGATILAAAALEALLLWALKNRPISKPSSKPLDGLHLADLIRYAADNKVISEGTKSQVSLAKDARNLIHPGRALRSGEACNRTTSLTALTAVYRVIDELRASA